MKQPAVFIDRDGTLVEEVNYLSNLDDLVVFPFTKEALKSLKHNGFITVVITNQSGIGRGIYTESAMDDIHRAIQQATGDSINAFYHCPHLPDANCECRKPGLGMIKAACTDHNIDLANSWMIGDKTIDVLTGVNAGIKTAMVMTGYGREHRAMIEVEPDIYAENFGDAVQEILRSRRHD